MHSSVGRSSDVQRGNVENPFDEGFPSSSKPARPRSRGAQTQASIIGRRGSLTSNTAPITFAEKMKFEADSSEVGSRYSSARSSRLSSAESTPGSALKRKGSFLGRLNSAISMTGIFRTGSAASVMQEEIWDTDLAKEVHKVAKRLCKLNERGQTLSKEVLDGCQYVFSEVLSARSLTAQEAHQIRILFKEVVSVSYNSSDNNDNALARASLVKQLYDVLKRSSYEVCIQLIDGGLIRRLATNEWCDCVQEGVENKLPRTLVLLEIPAVKMYLTHVCIRSKKYDFLSAILGMNLLHLNHSSANTAKQRRKCAEFAEMLAEVHFNQNSDNYCNIEGQNADELFHRLRNLASASDIGLAISDCLKAFFQSIAQMEGDLFMTEHLLSVEERERRILSKIDGTKADAFYEEFAESVQEKMENVEEEPENDRERAASSWAASWDLPVVDYPLDSFRKFFKLESISITNRARASSIAEEKDSLEGTSIDDEI